MPDNEVESFLSAVKETSYLWRSVDLRLIAVQAEGVWHNMVARFLLDPRLPTEVVRPDDFPHLPYFAVLQEVYKPEELPDLIVRVQSGSLEIHGHLVHFLASDSDQRFSKPYTTSSSWIGRDISDVVRGPYRHGHSLTFTGNQASYVYRLLPRGEEGLNADLRGLPDPWGGISDVLLHTLDEAAKLRGDGYRWVNFVAPLQGRIIDRDCTLSGDLLTYTVRAGSKVTGESCILVITGIDNRERRVARRVSLGGRRWTRVGDELQYTGTEKLKGAKSLTLTLRLANFELGQTKLKDRTDTTPLLLSAYEALFPGQRNFMTGLLQPVRTESRSFEKQVALLFTYCGMPVEYIGDGPNTQEAPDILVQVPDTPIVLVVEVTVGPLNQKGKLARLAQRADEVRREVKEAGGVVQPVIVTANPTSAIAKDELDDAKANGIRVLSRDDLILLLRMATRRAPARQVAKYLAPHQIPGTLSPLWGLMERNRYPVDESD